MDERQTTLMENDKFLEDLIGVETPEDVEACMKENGIELDGITPEEVLDIVKKQESGELSEAELEGASGGIALTVALGAIASGVLGYAACVALVSCAYHKLKKSKKK